MLSPCTSWPRCTRLQSPRPAFQDGNKRTAILMACAFLHANGLEFDFAPHDDEAVEMMEDIATGAVGREEVATWISRNTIGASE